MSDDRRARAQALFDYHQRVKHRPEAYAAGPETLDWDAQPDPFRTFVGAPRENLPLAPQGLATTFAEAQGVARTQPLTRANIGALLHLAFGLSAWKEFGPDRWALRCPPSSGNLHPTEAYLLAQGVENLPDGLYHYAVREHALEHRFKPEAAAAGAPALWVGLSSIHWREAWKYGERAFRYCQLDMGHALAALRIAAGVLGWRAQIVRGLEPPRLAGLLGLDRPEDFVGAEAEEAEILVALTAQQAPPDFAAGAWTGQANLLDRRKFYHWPVIEEAAQASQGAAEGNAEPRLKREPPPNARRADEIILQRRSAQRFDAKYRMDAATFYALLASALPGAAPVDLWSYASRLDLLLFVHRVEGLAPGLYALPRCADANDLRGALAETFLWRPVEGAPADLPLFLLHEGDCRALARKLFCHQAIAADGCFAICMLADFEAPVMENPWRYRQLHWEAGMIGHALYLEAETQNLRGTGIGCFLDDSLHGLLGLRDGRRQSLYQFTIGRPLVDERLQSLPAYPGKDRPG